MIGRGPRAEAGGDALKTAGGVRRQDRVAGHIGERDDVAGRQGGVEQEKTPASQILIDVGHIDLLASRSRTPEIFCNLRVGEAPGARKATASYLS